MTNPQQAKILDAGGVPGAMIMGDTKALTAKETERLLLCEVTIEKGLETFIEVGLALVEVRESKLYRFKFGTFEEYCEKRWQMTARRARQICAGAEVVANLRPGPPLPTSERQVRPLAGLPATEQREVWKDAVAAAPAGEAPTGKQVQEAVDKRKPRIFTVEWSRLDHGDIDEAYSGDRLMIEPAKIRPPFQFEEKLWCNGGACKAPTKTGCYAECYELIRADLYSGPKSPQQYSYEGYRVIWDRVHYRLGPKTTFRAGREEKLAPAPPAPRSESGPDQKQAQIEGTANKAYRCLKSLNDLVEPWLREYVQRAKLALEELADAIENGKPKAKAPARPKPAKWQKDFPGFVICVAGKTGRLYWAGSAGLVKDLAKAKRYPTRHDAVFCRRLHCRGGSVVPYAEETRRLK
jgi:hypothetical protein